MCDISIRGISMLLQRARIKVDETPANLVNLILAAHKHTVLNVSPEIAELSVNLNDEMNSDPAVRLIAATSILKRVPLVTADKSLQGASIVKAAW